MGSISLTCDHHVLKWLWIGLHLIFCTAKCVVVIGVSLIMGLSIASKLIEILHTAQQVILLACDLPQFFERCKRGSQLADPCLLCVSKEVTAVLAVCGFMNGRTRQMIDGAFERLLDLGPELRMANKGTVVSLCGSLATLHKLAPMAVLRKIHEKVCVGAVYLLMW